VRELALHILDILQNAVEAGATRVDLNIEEDQPGDRLTITVTDNGRGMDPAVAAHATDPFFTTRTTRHVGLGLPLFAAAAELTGGKLTIDSQPGIGTAVQATFGLFHPDRQPLGNLPDTLLAFLLSERAPDLSFHHRIDGEAFTFDTADIRAALDDVPLTYPSVRWWLAGFLAEGEAQMVERRWQVTSGF
jgi:hypothetical protein